MPTPHHLGFGVLKEGFKKCHHMDWGFFIELSFLPPTLKGTKLG
jgi:hypothetical protein